MFQRLLYCMLVVICSHDFTIELMNLCTDEVCKERVSMVGRQTGVLSWTCRLCGFHKVCIYIEFAVLTVALIIQIYLQSDAVSDWDI